MAAIQQEKAGQEEQEETVATVPLVGKRRRNWPFATMVGEVLVPYLTTRLALVLVGLLTELYLLPLMKPNPIEPPLAQNTQFPTLLWEMWRRFDAGFYINIAQGGYWPASTLNSASNWIFHPLYPMLIYVFGHLFGGSDAAFDIGAVLVSNVAGLVAVTYLYLLVRREFSSKVAARTIIYLAVFPTSFYLSAAFSESVFLVCAIGCLYYAREHRWWLAGIFGGLGSLARIQGLVLVVPVLWEYWQVLSDRYAPLPDMSAMMLAEKGEVWLRSRTFGVVLAAQKIRSWLELVAVALIPLGIVPFFIYSQIKTGDFLASIHNHSVGWDRHTGDPVRLVIDSLLNPLPPNAMEWNFWALNMIMIFVFTGFIIWAFRRLPMIYALYTLVMVVMPLCTGSVKSISRYYLLVFPAFMLLALWSSRGKSEGRNVMIISLCAPIMAVCMVFFVLGLPLIA